jgi:glyoxylate/hydroxypyruvate reductase A
VSAKTAMVLLFKSEVMPEAWIGALQALEPGLEVRVWPHWGAPAEADFALVWKPPKGELANYPNLKVIFSIGAGIDHLASDPELPRHIPLVRMVDPSLTAGMTEYVVMSVLHHHRFMLDYTAQQQAGQWRLLDQIPPWRRRVGVMGLGVLGGDALAKLKVFDFDLAGWSRRPKAIPGVETFHGSEGFTEFLAGSEILVCLLPLTAETEGILNVRTFQALPRGAAVINAARGGHLVDADLLEALASGQVAGATLDVFHQEPLPAEHPFWAHPRVIVTPHAASLTIPETAARYIVDSITKARAGQPLDNVVDLARGY